jgi:hypothetical protein
MQDPQSVQSQYLTKYIWLIENVKESKIIIYELNNTIFILQHQLNLNLIPFWYLQFFEAC